MAITTVATFTPTDRTQTVYTIGTTVIALQVFNPTTFKLRCQVGPAQGFEVSPGDNVLVQNIVSLSWVTVTPEQSYLMPPLPYTVASVVITSYASGDTLPAAGVTTPAYLAPFPKLTHDPLNELGFGTQVIPIRQDTSLPNTLLTTTAATTVATVTNAVDGLYLCCLNLRVVTASTVVTATATATGDAATAQSYTLFSQTAGGALTVLTAATLTTGEYVCVPVPVRFVAGGATVPTITVTAGTASQVFCTASIIKIA